MVSPCDTRSQLLRKQSGPTTLRVLHRELQYHGGEQVVQHPVSFVVDFTDGHQHCLLAQHAHRVEAARCETDLRE
jgi:hypothetical protein